MRISDDVLNSVYDRTRGYCHICGRKVSFRNHGCINARGAWEVEHSRARALGGTNRLNNLYPACTPCNRSKGVRSTRSARAAHGRTRAPHSRARREEIQMRNALLAGALGAWLGSRIAGGEGAVWGGLIGAGVGASHDPDRA